MFGNFKHTMECKSCKGKEQFETFPNKEKCECGGELEYIGFQPYIDPILEDMLRQAKIANNKIKTKEVKVEEIEIEEVGIEKVDIKESSKVLKNVQIEVINETTQNEENKITSSEVVNEVVSEKNISEANTLTIDDIFDTNDKMTNAKMEPLMKQFIPNNEVEKLKLLKEYYPSTFEKAIKYIGKKNQTKLEELMADFN